MSMVPDRPSTQVTITPPAPSETDTACCWLPSARQTGRLRVDELGQAASEAAGSAGSSTSAARKEGSGERVMAAPRQRIGSARAWGAGWADQWSISPISLGSAAPPNNDCLGRPCPPRYL